jgi:hypothetical protein
MDKENINLEDCKKQECELTLEERYKILIQARNFHYENFNKWMTYFYVAIGAIFVGYCTFSSSNNNEKLEYNLTLLGYLVSILLYWSAKGYYYWNINFITLVNYYEEKLLKFKKTERVYFVFANTKTQNNYFNPISGANISTSKITILFAFIITIFWGVAFLDKLFVDNKVKCNYVSIIELMLSVISVIILSYFVPKNFLSSKNDHFPDLKIKQG